MQDVNRIPAEVIKQHSLSSSAQRSSAPSQPQSSTHGSTDSSPAELLSDSATNGSTDSSPADLPSKLHQLSIAGPSSTEQQHSASVSRSQATDTKEPTAASTDGSHSQQQASDQRVDHQQALSDQRCGLKHCTQSEAGQIPVPVISIAGWDESPVSVSC